MFGIGMPEMILILAVALIVIGPKKLPDLAKSLGKAMGEFKKATSDLKESMQIDSELKDVKTAFDDIGGDDKKETKMTTGETVEKPVDTAIADEPPDAASTQDSDANPMDNLKAVFDQRNTDTANVDANAPADSNAPAPDADQNEKTPKG